MLARIVYLARALHRQMALLGVHAFSD